MHERQPAGPVKLRGFDRRQRSSRPPHSGPQGNPAPMSIIYRKSAKGVAEIETRAHRLPPRLRSALIIIDGKRSANELKGLILAQADETLASLLEQGFIEAAGSAAAAPARASAAPSPASTPAARPATADFDTRRRDMVRRLTDLVGPLGEALAMRMERTRNAEELRPLLAVALQVIANTRGRAAAAEFEARFSDL